MKINNPVKLYNDLYCPKNERNKIGQIREQEKKLLGQFGTENWEFHRKWPITGISAGNSPKIFIYINYPWKHICVSGESFTINPLKTYLLWVKNNYVKYMALCCFFCILCLILFGANPSYKTELYLPSIKAEP